MLGRINHDLESIRNAIAEVCQVNVAADGLVFESATVTTERIAEDADYYGVRAKFLAKLGAARIPMQIDIGFSDVVTPAPIKISYPTILELPTGDLLAYNRETAVAEKFEAMVKLGELNSRMKDFFDVSHLAANYQFSGPVLAAAILATFNQRQRAIQIDPVCFTQSFIDDLTRIAQWNAFIRRNNIANAEFSPAIDTLRVFLRPVATSLVNQVPFDRQWNPGGPWR